MGMMMVKTGYRHTSGQVSLDCDMYGELSRIIKEYKYGCFNGRLGILSIRVLENLENS